MSEYKYSTFRCLDPNFVITDKPWYPYQDVCPCDPKLSNPTGRGYTSCPYGVQTDIKSLNKEISKKSNVYEVIDYNNINGYQTKNIPVTQLPLGSLYQNSQITAPQMDPRQLVRIGNEWRSAW